VLSSLWQYPARVVARPDGAANAFGALLQMNCFAKMENEGRLEEGLRMSRTQGLCPSTACVHARVALYGVRARDHRHLCASRSPVTRWNALPSFRRSRLLR
jgi:hypothetical protein